MPRRTKEDTVPITLHLSKDVVVIATERSKDLEFKRVDQYVHFLIMQDIQRDRPAKLNHGELVKRRNSRAELYERLDGQVERIADLIALGLSLQQIARECNVSDDVLRCYIDKHVPDAEGDW